MLAPWRRTIEPAELVEDRALVLLRNARPRVPDLDLCEVAASPAADEHATALRVAQRIRDEVLQDATQQHAIAPDTAPRAREAQPQAAPCRQRNELPLEVLERLRNREVGNVGAHRAAFEPGDVEHVVEHLLGCAHRAVDALGDLGDGGIVRALAQRRGEEPRGVQRLQQVVARRGDEAALGGVRFLGLPLCVLLRGERRLEFAGSLLHPLLEGLLGLEQRQLGALELGDVVVGRDVAPVRQRLAADLIDVGRCAAVAG